MAEGSSEIWLNLDEILNNLIPKKLRIVIAVGGAIDVLISIIYLYILLQPQLTFSGFLQGYIALTGYSIKFAANGNSIYMTNIDAVRIVSIATVFCVLALLITSIASVAIVKRKPVSAAALAYGTALSLVITSGVIRYLTQAFWVDASKILSLIQRNNNGVLRFTTSAGVIEFRGVEATETIAYKILFRYQQTILVILTIAVVVSLASVTWIIYIYGKHIEARRKPSNASSTTGNAKSITKTVKTAVIPVAIAMLIMLNAMASVFTYYPLQLVVQPVTPPIKFIAPPTTYCINIAKTSRGAIAYTDFEWGTTIPGNWTVDSGDWSVSSIGYKGQALSGADTKRKRDYAFIYDNSDTVYSYNSLWISVKTKLTSGGGYYGIAIADDTLNNIYFIAIDSTSGSLGIYKSDWKAVSTPSMIPNYNSNNWYVLVVNYTYSSVTQTLSIRARVYDVNGNLLSIVTYTATGVSWTPYYIGLVVRDVKKVGLPSALFDDYILSTTDPRAITIQNTVPGYSVSVFDNLGNLVNSTVASSTTTRLGVVPDIVVGTGVDGRIVIYYPDGAVCSVYNSPDAILGGDTYSVNLGTLSYVIGSSSTSLTVSAKISSSSTSFTGTVFLSIVNVDSKKYYVRLLLDASSSSVAILTANVTLYNATKYFSTPIRVVGGVVVSSSTSWVVMGANTKVNASFIGYATQAGQGYLNMLLEYCTLPNEQGACVYYPVKLSFST